MTTNVPGITYGPSGPILPTEAAILTGVKADFNAAFGGGLDQDLTTPQGQLATSEAAIIGDKNNDIAEMVNQVNPVYSTGRWQDALGQIYFLSRNPAQPTSVDLVCTGLAGVVIPPLALAQDVSGNIYACVDGGTIGLGGSVTLSFANTVNGPIACPANSVTTIYQAIPGWDTVDNPAEGVIGNDVESASAFEARRIQSVSINARGTLPAIQGAVLAVPNVLDAYTTENATGSPATIGGVSLAAHSLYVAVSGGDDDAVATAIWTKKPPGCAYNGNTTVTVYDANSGYEMPYPAYSVTFERPTAVPVLFAIVLRNSNLVPSNALTLVQNAIVNAFAGGDGGPRARIGETLFASRYYSTIAALGPWAQIIDIQLAPSTPTTAQFTGAIGGTTLTVSAVAGGALAVGQLVLGAGVSGSTFITALGSGSGGTGTYTISQSMTVSSEAMTSVAFGNSATLNINQVPTISTADVNLLLQ